jgi:1-phosphofructokinase family hexose kinase
MKSTAPAGCPPGFAEVVAATRGAATRVASAAGVAPDHDHSDVTVAAVAITTAAMAVELVFERPGTVTVVYVVGHGRASVPRSRPPERPGGPLAHRSPTARPSPPDMTDPVTTTPSPGRRRAAMTPPAQLVCVALSPSIDVTYLVPRLVPGGIHRLPEVYRVPGGKGFNVARAAHTLGANVVATGVLGGDSGAWLLAMLTRTGIRITPVTGARPTRTCVSVADSTTGEVTEFYGPAPPITPRAWADLVTTVARICEERPSWVSLSGSLPPGPVPEAIGDLVTAAKGAGARVAVDTHTTALAAAVGAGADLVKVNVEEAAALLGAGHGTGYPTDDGLRDDPEALAAALLAACPGTRIAIVTAGADGAVLVSRDGTAFHLHLDLRADYPAGSGDSFLGGLLTALADGPDDLEAAARLAVGAGAANALTPGAGVLDATTARDLAGQVAVTVPRT